MNAFVQKEQELLDSMLGSDSAEWAKLQQELSYFHSEVQQVLREYFRPEQYKSLSVLLRHVNGGKLEYVFNCWLDELYILDLLPLETIENYKESYNAKAN